MIQSFAHLFSLCRTVFLLAPGELCSCTFHETQQRSVAPHLGVLLQLMELLEGEAQVVDLVPKRQPNTSKYKAAGPTPRVRCPIVFIEPPGEAASWKESPRYRTYRRRGLDKKYMYCT